MAARKKTASYNTLGIPPTQGPSVSVGSTMQCEIAASQVDIADGIHRSRLATRRARIVPLTLSTGGAPMTAGSRSKGRPDVGEVRGDHLRCHGYRGLRLGTDGGHGKRRLTQAILHPPRRCRRLCLLQ